MKNTNSESGFSAVELLVTLFIAVAFLTSGYQLFLLIIKDGGESRSSASAYNTTYDYLQRYKGSTTNPCTVQSPLTNSSISVTGLSAVTVTIAITCPYGTTSTVSKVQSTVKYSNPQITVSEATYVTP